MELHVECGQITRINGIACRYRDEYPVDRLPQSQGATKHGIDLSRPVSGSLQEPIPLLIREQTRGVRPANERGKAGESLELMQWLARVIAGRPANRVGEIQTHAAADELERTLKCASLH
jgi:hypothetical protein